MQTTTTVRGQQLVMERNSFDAIRYLLVAMLIFHHYISLTDTTNPLAYLDMGGTVVRGFLVMSGFLVYTSYERSKNLNSYLLKRAKRILPAYIFIVLLCAFGGVLLSQLSFTAYFANSEVYKYLLSNLSTLNFLQSTLPSVFEHNPIPAVNGSLWTIKVEIALYLTIPVVHYLCRKMPKIPLLLFIYVASTLYSEWLFMRYAESGNGLYIILERQFLGQMKYYYSAVFILLYFEQFKRYIYPLAALSILLLFLGHLPLLCYLKPLAFATLLIAAAYTLSFLQFVGRYTNISYAMYLFHCPIIQILISYDLHKEHFWATLLLAYLLTISLSIISWHLVEKHFLQRKKRG